MKKIMFNDRYGLTQAVLERKKTMTRRIVNYPKKFKGVEDTMLEFNRRIGADIYYDCVVCDADGHELGQLPLPYEVGDVVAIAQPYKNDDVLTYNAYNKDGTAREDGLQRHKEMLGSKGYRNKMFVKAEYMPHRIRITGIKVERLQNISDDDCLKEGIHVHNPEPGNPNFIGYAYDATPGTNVKRWWFHTPREAFAALINRVSGPHTWDCNPWVIAYTFELVD